MDAAASDPRVGDLSEGAVLRSILDRLGGSRAEVGPGDDAAVIAVPDGRIVATVDTLVHGPDFRLAWSRPFDLGWKSAAVNLADIAAMGARPVSLLVALAMPDETRLSFVRDFADGLRAACDDLAPGCTVEGGDLTVSDTLTVAVTALGSLEGRRPILRTGAQPGDVVALSGDVGQAAWGLDILFSMFRDDAGNPLPIDGGALDAGEAAAVASQLRPRPPVHAGPIAASDGATAMMDVSDGLVLDASRLADASEITIDIESAELGPHPQRALTGGEDHALLATFPAGTALRAGFRVIGSVRARGTEAVTVDGRRFVGRGGWDPYQDWDSARG